MNNNEINNPFVIGRYVSPDYFCDREEETAFLKKQIDNGRNTALIAPRRLGKTGLIHHLFAQDEIIENHYAFFVDIYATGSLSEFAYLFGNTIYKQLKPLRTQWAEKFFQVITSLRAGFKLDALTGEPTFDIGIGEIEQPQTTLDEIFAYLEAADKPCIVAIDEFQQIMKYDEKNIEALLRTKIQECKRTVFIFSGSQRHLMSQMFHSPSKPFYQSVISVDLKPLERQAYIDFSQRQFAQNDKTIDQALVGMIYDAFEGTTWYMQMMMNELYALTPKGEKCEIEMFEIAKRNVIIMQETNYKELLQQVPNKQKPVLLALAKERTAVNALSGSFVKKHGLSSTSSVQSALKGLMEKDLITRTEKGYCVYDFFFAEWLRHY